MLKSAWTHLLNYQSFRHTQLISFLDKMTGPILPFVFLPEIDPFFLYRNVSDALGFRFKNPVTIDCSHPRWSPFSVF